jgi:hypothetical protein
MSLRRATKLRADEAFGGVEFDIGEIGRGMDVLHLGSLWWEGHEDGFVQVLEDWNGFGSKEFG